MFSTFFAHHFTPSLFFHTFIFADLFNRVEILIWDMKTKAVFHGKSTYPVRDFLDKNFSQYSLLIITYTQSDPINNENVCILMVSQRAPKQVCNAHFKTEKKQKQQQQ